MAGIGFELRDLFAGKGLFRKMNAVLVSSFVTVGPSLFCMGAIAFLQVYMRRTQIRVPERELFLSLLTYAFIFSLVLTGGVALTASRYVSNRLFKGERDAILPSLYGTLLFLLAFVGAIAALFLAGLPLPVSDRVAAWYLVMLLSAIWLESVYLSAIHGHRYLAGAFIVGMLVGMGGCVGLLALHRMPESLAMLIGMDIGFAFILGAFHMKLLRSFGCFRSTLRVCLNWMSELDQYPQLPFIGFLYYVGLYSHNFTYWAGSSGRWLQGNLRFAPGYDMPSFVAILSIFPALVYLVVRFETSLATQCRIYYEMASGQGSIQDIRMAGHGLIATVESELELFMRLQLIVTLMALFIGIRVLPLIGASFQVVDVFSALTLGNFGFICLYAVCLILLYLDDRAGAFLLLAMFNVLAIGLSVLAQWMGDAFQGVGYVAAAMLTLPFALLWLSRRLGDLECRTFAHQPVYRAPSRSLLQRIHTLIPRKE